MISYCHCYIVNHCVKKTHNRQIYSLFISNTDSSCIDRCCFATLISSHHHIESLQSQTRQQQQRHAPLRLGCLRYTTKYHHLLHPTPSPSALSSHSLQQQEKGGEGRGGGGERGSEGAVPPTPGVSLLRQPPPPPSIPPPLPVDS